MSKAVDLAYVSIRDDILSGRIKPGERLREEELTRRIGVSRTPVREALRRLEADGFTIVQPNRGASVPIYSRRDIDEIYGLRALIEGHAARRAATRITPEQIDELARLNDAMRAMPPPDAPGDPSPRHLDRVTLNHAFHRIILEAADNRRLSAMVSQLARVALSARTFARYSAADEARAIENHDELIRALRAGHPDWAEATMRSHVHNARQIMTTLAVEHGEVADEELPAIA
jgi:DNA-binding GntR family transcriptional regulator